jgi:hypothetical protein
MANLVPILSSSPLWPSVGDAFSWITIQNDVPRELYAQAVYTVNHGNNYDNVDNHTVRTTNGQVLSANSIRKALYCRNLSNVPLYIKFGLSASSTSFNVLLKGNTDGIGEAFFDDQVYHGEVSVYSTTPNYMLWEGF